MAAVLADVLGESGARGDEGDPVPREDANRRMLHDDQIALGLQKRVPAETCVLDKPIARGDPRDPVTDQPAQITNLLVEDGGVGVRIAIGGKQQRVTALHAHVLVIAVAIDQPLICVMSEKTREGMSDARRTAVGEEIRLAAPAIAVGAVVSAKHVIVDVMAPHGARQPRERSHRRTVREGS